MQITAWGKQAELIDFLNDVRVHPAITMDVVKKRIKRGWIPEIALTKGVADEAKVGDTQKRKKTREEKALHRCKMFLLAQEVRRKHAAGVELIDLQERYKISKSQVEKFVSGNEYWNVHWSGTSIPDEFASLVEKLNEKNKNR